MTYICVRIIELGEWRGSLEGEDMCAWMWPFYQASSIVRLRRISVKLDLSKKQDCPNEP